MTSSLKKKGLFKTIEVWAANKECAVSFNEKNYKNEPGLNLL